jgi:ankyrin repeat protein
VLETQSIDVNARNKTGCTALFHAVAHGYSKIVRLLSSYRANANITDEDVETPFTIVRQMNQLETAEIRKAY